MRTNRSNARLDYLSRQITMRFDWAERDVSRLQGDLRATTRDLRDEIRGVREELRSAVRELRDEIRVVRK